MKKGITRLCVFCKEPINIDSDDTSNDTYIYDKCTLHGYAHKTCFIQKKTTQKRNQWTLEQCMDWIETATQKMKSRLNQRYLTDWIFKTYNITFLPQYFYTKLSNILNGSYEKVSRPIPVEDLLDMWQRKIDYLNKLSAANQSKGKIIEGVNRVNYDLSILLSKYDTYLAWKETIEAENKKVKERIDDSNKGVNYSVIPSYSTPKDEQKKVDISSIIDEI